MDILILAAAAALGVLLYMFLTLIYWDLFSFLPMPWGPYCYPNKEAYEKKKMKIVFFILGVIATVILSTAFKQWSQEWLGAILLLGFSAPLTVLFLGRIAITVIFGVVSIYQRSETVYEGIKLWVRQQLRKRGRIE